MSSWTETILCLLYLFLPVFNCFSSCLISFHLCRHNTSLFEEYWATFYHLYSGDEDEELDPEFGSASKKRRTVKTVKAKKSLSNKCVYLWFPYNIGLSFWQDLCIKVMSSYCLHLCLSRVSASMNSILQKLCTILGLLKDLLLIDKLSDSCILQLVKTSFTTFLVDNIQLLQLKAIGLLSGVRIYCIIFSFKACTYACTYVMYLCIR